MTVAQRPEAALVRTRRRLVLVTMSLVVGLLVLAAGVAAVLANQALDASVDNALAGTVDSVLQALDAAQPAATPASTHAPTPAPTTGSGDDDQDDEDRSGNGGSSGSDGGDGEEGEEHSEPAAADTVVLQLDGAGGVLATRAAVPIAGLPDAASIAAAERTGRDLRTIEVGGRALRVLTVAVPGESGTVRYVQAAFVLTLHDRQVADLLWAMVVVVALGVAGAVLVAWVVVDRALSPVRAALEHERAFVAAASHELRTPVAVIRGTAEVLRREDLVAPGGAPLLADMEAEADRLGSLVGDLAALSAAQAAPVAASTRLDLAVLARDVVRRAGPLAAARGVRLELAGADPVEVRTDPDRLIQVALILIDNALRVTPAGRAIRVSATARERAGELSVEDEGPGIREVDRDRIFEPFVRGAGDQAGAGSGLGLSIARSLVERLGGRIRLETASGGGARFTVAVPRA